MAGKAETAKEATPLVNDAKEEESVSATARRSAEELMSDVKSGQDALGSIIKQVSRRNKKLDRFFHCCNGVGFEWADSNRVLVMLLASLTGAAVFATSFCGMMGLFPTALDTLPWARFNHADVTIATIAWWACGTATSCFAQFFSGANPGLYGTGPFVSLCLEHANATCSEGDVTCACRSFLKSGSTTVAVSHADWTLNQWGICFFPDDEWVVKAVQFSNGASSDPLETHAGGPFGGTCRPWGEWTDTPGAEGLESCSKPTVDGFALIVGTFGGFMKIVEPFSRMKRATDLHQKTIILLIIAISTIPPSLGLISFATGCVNVLEADYSQYFGTSARYDLGAVLFTVSVGLLAPIALLHVIVPSGALTAIDDEA